MKTSTLIPLFGLFAVLTLGGLRAQECTDGTCSLPADTVGVKVYTPVPGVSVTPIKPAKRVKDLNGKTFALVGGSFMANVTHPELKRLILKEFPDAKVYVLSEVGSAGPFPRPGVKRPQKEEFQKKLRELHVDVVVAGNGGCGLCTPKETGSCIAAEEIGIPAVMIAAPGFTKQAKSTALSAGLPVMRVAEYPGAFSSDSREVLQENTRKVLWPQIKKALTEPIGDVEKMQKPEGEEEFGSMAEAQQAFMDSGWTDGLPINLPTEEVVAEFLAFTDLAPDTVVGSIPPAQRAVTVRHVAVNGAMAGCPPEFMPILIAFVECMKDGDFRRPLISTHAWTPYCWLNGPVARQIGFDCGQGEINEHKNAQLGRFINLAMQNLGGYYVKENRMGTYGYLMPWCLVENEKAALEIGWKPHHMQYGFQLNDSTITAASSINWGNNLVPATSDAVKIKDVMACDAVEKSQMAIGSGMPCVYRAFLITGSVAKGLSKVYHSKADLEKALIETARIPVGQRAFANYWGNPGSAFNPQRYSLGQHERHIAEAEGASTTATPPWLKWTGIERMETVPAMAAGKNAFIITGDPARNKSLCVPGGGFITVKINLPKNWDKLMAARGYEPLSKFRLKSDLKPDAPKPKQRQQPRTSPRGDLAPQGGGDGQGRRPQGGTPGQGRRPGRRN